MKMIPYVKKYLTEYYEFILTSATSKKEEKQWSACTWLDYVYTCVISTNKLEQWPVSHFYI